MTALTPLTPAQDPYAQRSVPAQSPARNAAAITKSDTVDQPYKGIWVGGVGNVTVLMINATDDTQTVTFTAVPAGTLLPIQVRRVMSTGTSATLMVGLEA